MDDIIHILHDTVISPKLIYILYEEVVQIVFDTFENIINICIQNNKATYTINEELVIGATMTIVQLLMSDLKLR